MLLLSLTDQFDSAPGAHRGARDVLAGLTSEYDREYYAGIIAERLGKTHFARAGAAASAGVYEWLMLPLRSSITTIVIGWISLAKTVIGWSLPLS